MVYMRTNDLMKLLKDRYAGGSYAFFTNVADGTGSNVSRWADGLAISLWPSRGLTLEGFELKVSRSDWLRELQNPAKAEAVCKYCDYWWVVTSEPDIVKDDELPGTWGLICANDDGSKLKVKVKAPRLSPVPLDRHIVAAIARRACEQSAEVELIEAAKQEGIEKGRNEREFELRELREIRSRVETFQKVTGIDLGNRDYNFSYHKPEEIGAAVMLVLDKQQHYQHQIDMMRNAANRILEIVGDKQPDPPRGRNGSRKSLHS